MAVRSWFEMVPPLGLAISMTALLAACSGTGGGESPVSEARVARPAFTEKEYGVSSSPRLTQSRGPQRKGGGHYKLGSPYKVAGRWYVPREDRSYDRKGVASWYGDDFHGRKTSNGEIFDRHALSAAHPTMPLPSYAYVTNLENNRTVLVRVNDRGPYVGGRIIDLSHASATALGYVGQGRARVRVRYAGRAPLNGNDGRERAFLAQQRWNGGSGGDVAFAEPPRTRLLAPRPQVADASHRSGGWSPTGYRSALAGKPVSETRSISRANSEQPLRTADWNDRRSGGDAGSAEGGLVWKASPRAPARYSATGSINQGRTGGSPAYVQVGTYRERSTAENLRTQLGALGPVEVAPVAVDGNRLYRVRIGPLKSQQAQTTLANLSSRGLNGAVVSE